MKIKKLCAVALLLLLSFYAKAQNWQAYKGVWLKGYDNATQAPVPPSGYSALTYFADSLGTYVYDWDSLAWLRIPGTGGGGGGLVTADNGLTVSSPTNVQLGGTLIRNTTIPLAGFSYTIGQFPDNVNFSVNDGSNSITANLSAGSSGALFSMTASNAVFQHSGAAGTATLTLNQSTETGTISSSSGSQINLNVATPASPVITTQSAENFTISKPLGLMSSSGSLQIGGPDGLATSLENTESGNTAIFDVRGTNETFLMRSGSGGSTLTVNVASSAQVNISTASDQLQLGTSNAKLLFDDSDDTALFSADVVLQKVPTELDTAVWFLARDFNTGAIVQRKGGGGGGFTTADNGLIANTVSNVRIGTSAQPGEVLDEGAVFSTDSLNVGVSHFWFMPDSVQIGNMTDLGEGDEPAYVLMKDGTVSAHASTTELRLQKGGTNTMQVLFGGNPLFSFGSTLLRYGSSGLTPSPRLFEIANGDLLQFTSRIGDDMAFQTMDGATGTQSTGDILIRTGSVTSGTGAVGNIEIRLGTQAGGGAGGTLQLDPSSGFLTIVNIPTSDPCGSAPSGTVWADSGVLKVCP